MSTATPPVDPPVEILIVEDSPTQSQRLQHILEQQGYRVTAAANGRQALESAQQRRPDLIISDVIMPEMDGYELCRRLKAQAQFGDTPVILVTTLSDPGDVIRGLECRADNFILKPYDERDLLGRVQFVLVNREMRRTDQTGIGVEIFFNGHKHFITADRLQILNLLLSTYEAAIQRNKELSRTQEELHRLNARLEVANKELESFSYSVSHDLRAPLRHIGAFAGLLKQRAGDKLDEKSLEHVSHIEDAAKEMGQLIDDLLAFSRMGRAEMQEQTVDLETVVRDTLQAMHLDLQTRNIQWNRAPLPSVRGDPALLRQVFANLLSNAIKYSRPRDQAVIEIGCREESPEEWVLYVRDNGVGFDMTYADKLFGAFQRLHSAEDFEGTGIGLANVRRIITRHGGRIWAEGEVNKGATFYFSLPKSNRREP